MKKFTNFNFWRFSAIAALVAIPSVLFCGCDKSPVPEGEETDGVPRNVRLVSSSETSLTFAWSPVEGADYYYWRLLEADSTRHSANSTRDTTATVSDLTTGTTYSFSVASHNGTAESEYSEPVTGTPRRTSRVSRYQR